MPQGSAAAAVTNAEQIERIEKHGAAWPLAAHAQQLARRIGMLETIPPQANAANFDALRKGLREVGYYDGRSLIIEYRSADGRAERFPALAAELVRLKVDVGKERRCDPAR